MLTKWRKVIIAVAGLGFLLAGLIVCAKIGVFGPQLFPGYMTGVMGVVGMGVTGNVLEHFSNKDKAPVETGAKG